MTNGIPSSLAEGGFLFCGEYPPQDVWRRLPDPHEALALKLMEKDIVIDHSYNGIGYSQRTDLSNAVDRYDSNAKGSVRFRGEPNNWSILYTGYSPDGFPHSGAFSKGGDRFTTMKVGSIVYHWLKSQYIDVDWNEDPGTSITWSYD